MTERRVDLLVAAGLFLAVAGTTCAVSSRQGVHRDEALYMQMGEQYVAYWERLVSGQHTRPLSADTIAQYFGRKPGDGGNPEHPPLLKTLSGLSFRLFHRCECAKESGWHPGPARLAGDARHLSIPLLSETTAFRLPTIALFGLLAALVYLFFVQAFGSRAGALAAALLTAAQPRAFFHAQTAAFDLPAATLWFATTWAYWRALASPRPIRAAIPVGLLFGAFLATKLQSFFLPVALGAHWLWLGVSRRRRGGAARARSRP